MEVNRRFADRWSANVSYTWSQFEGNIDYDYGGGTAVFNTSSIYQDGPGTFVGDQYRYGPLREDRPHVFKVFANVEPIDNLMLGGYLRVQSGTPWQARGQDSQGGSALFYLEPAGSHRNPTWTNFDFLASYRFKLSERAGLVLEARAFNLFNSQTQLLDGLGEVHRLQEPARGSLHHRGNDPQLLLRHANGVRGRAADRPRGAAGLLADPSLPRAARRSRDRRAVRRLRRSARPVERLEQAPRLRVVRLQPEGLAREAPRRVEPALLRLQHREVEAGAGARRVEPAGLLELRPRLRRSPSIARARPRFSCSAADPRVLRDRPRRGSVGRGRAGAAGAPCCRRRGGSRRRFAAAARAARARRCLLPLPGCGEGLYEKPPSGRDGLESGAEVGDPSAARRRRAAPGRVWPAGRGRASAEERSASAARPRRGPGRDAGEASGPGAAPPRAAGAAPPRPGRCPPASSSVAAVDRAGQRTRARARRGRTRRGGALRVPAPPRPGERGRSPAPRRGARGAEGGSGRTRRTRPRRRRRRARRAPTGRSPIDRPATARRPEVPTTGGRRGRGARAGRGATPRRPATAGASARRGRSRRSCS